jgi:hypothetical protein
MKISSVFLKLIHTFRPSELRQTSAANKTKHLWYSANYCTFVRASACFHHIYTGLSKCHNIKKFQYSKMRSWKSVKWGK